VYRHADHGEWGGGSGGGVYGGALRRGRRKAFFFEKKNQKTLAFLVGGVATRASSGRSFCFFFQKEALSFLSRLRR
jgi:hypothetical protein